MTLTLVAEGLDELDNGMPARLVLDQHGALVGRSPTADWCLPDTRNYVSSNHFEIDWRGGRYVLTDNSTNGTFVNGSTDRLDGPYVLAHGDVLTVGHYRLRVRLDGAAVPAPPPPAGGGGGWLDDPAPTGADTRWDDSPPPTLPSQSSLSRRPDLPPLDQPSAKVGWDDIPAVAAESGGGAGGFSYTPPRVTPAADRWPSETSEASDPRWPDTEEVYAPSPPPPPGDQQAWGQDPSPAGDDPWDVFLHAHEVVWPGDEPPPAPAPRPQPPPRPAPQPQPQPIEVRPALTPPPAPPPAPTPAAAVDDGAWRALLEVAGIDPDDIKGEPAAAAAAAGAVLQAMVSGLVRMVEARARAKAQMGAAGTIWEREGNNPLKFSRDPERALLQLLNPPERGFMAADRAVDSAFRDLQAHQMATLAAMQKALRATLDRFSPTAIRARAEDGGLMSRILPGAKEAALWKAYEREFDGVVAGSDEAFLDIFSKAFRQAYEEIAAEDHR